MLADEDKIEVGECRRIYVKCPEYIDQGSDYNALKETYAKALASAEQLGAKNVALSLKETDDIEDLEGTAMNRTSYFWPEGKHLCCLSVMTYEETSEELAEKVMSTVQKNNETSDISPLYDYEDPCIDDMQMSIVRESEKEQLQQYMQEQGDYGLHTRY